MKILRSISFLYHTLLDYFDYFLWNCFKPNGEHSCILMYHEITLDKINSNECCLHNIKDFQRTLERFELEGYEFVNIDKAVVVPPVGHKYVTVTFDDVHDSVFTFAYPILSKKQIPFTLFVAPNLLEKNGMMTIQHLIELARDPLCTIGAHTMNHPMLRNSQDCYYEILQSKKWLEKKLGKEIDFFAYPYGKHSSVSMKVMWIVKRIGFKRAFGTIDAPVTKFTSLFKYYLPRMVVHY